MAEPFLADLDRAVMDALKQGSDRIDELLREINCAPLELESTLKSLARMGIAACEDSGLWSLTAQGRRLTS